MAESATTNPIRETAPQQEVEQRAHQLYLLAHTLGHTRQSPEDPDGRARYVEFQRGLGSLSNRDNLTGDALFYRSLASEEALPAAALEDLLSLARDSEWLDTKRRHCPAFLLCLADRLWKAKRIKEARRVYARANASSIAPDRWVYCDLATHFPLIADEMMQVLQSPAASTLQPQHRFLMDSLCQLARTPPDCDFSRVLP